MDPEFERLLKENGIGDIDPVTGPITNPDYFFQRWYVLEYIKAAGLYENPEE